MRTHLVALAGFALAIACAAGLGVASSGGDSGGLKQRGLDATDITYLTDSFSIERPGDLRLVGLTADIDRALARCKALVVWQSDMSDRAVSGLVDAYGAIPGGLVMATDILSEDDKAAFREVADDFVDCYLNRPRVENGLYVPWYALKAARESASQH